jgi:tetratricopeptide (TPR) repeat protein
MIRPSKEVLILLAGLLVAIGGAYALLRQEAEGASTGAPKRMPRGYEAPRPVTEPYASPDLKTYWIGKDVTGTPGPAADVRDYDPIAIPPAPAPVLCVPPLRPWPRVRPPRTLPLVDVAAAPAAPAVPATPSAPVAPAAPATPAGEGAPRSRPTADQLPAAAELEQLLKVPDAPDAAIQDRSDEKVREFDVIHLRDAAQPLEGKILHETETQVIFRHKKGGMQQTINKSGIEKIERAWTNDEQVKADSKALPEGDAAGRVKLAKWCVERGMLPEAMAEYEKAIAIRPGDVSLALEQAALYRRLGRFNAEMETLQRAAQKGASDRELAWLALAEFHRAFGLFAESLEACQKALQTSPGFADALTVQAEVELALGRYEQAIATATKAVDRAKSPARAVTALAGAHLARGELDRAKVALDRAVSTGGAVYAPAANLLGVVQFLQGSYAEAAKSFALAAQTDPAQVQAVTNLGVLYLLAGRPAEAQKLFTLAGTRDPADPTPLVGQALALILATPQKPPAPAGAAPPPATPAPAAGADAAAPVEPKAPDAKSFLEKALLVDPRDAYSEYAAGMAFYAARVPAEAEKHLRASLRGETDAVPVLYALGVISLALGRAEEAEVCFARVVARGDATPEEQAALAIARCARGDSVRAGEDLQKLQSAYPRMVHVWNALAYIDYTHLRKVKEAIAKLKQALACDPTDEYAVATLYKIQESTSTQISEESFDRPDSDEVGNLWLELENTGVDIRIVDQRCLFTGVQRLNDWADTAIDREVEGQAFKEIEAEFDFRELVRAVAGIRVTYSTVGGGVTKAVYLVRDDRGNYAFSDHASSVIVPQWKVSPATLAIPALAGAPVGATGKPIARFKIVAPALADSARSRPFEFYVNDVKIGAVETPLKDQSVRYNVAVFVRAMKNIPIEFTVDNIKIRERKEIQ